MDQLRFLGSKLYSQLPCCLLCGHTVFEARVYLLFSCFHMLCQACSTQSEVNECSICPNSHVLVINYKVLNTVGEELRGAMRRLLDGDANGFPEAFTGYYNLVAATTHPAFEPEDRQAVPGTIAGRRETGQDWNCKCGSSNWKRLEQCSKCGERRANFPNSSVP